MKTILDKLFGRGKLSFWIPLATAAGMYIIFLLMGDTPYKQNLHIMAPVLGLFWYFGVYLVMGVLVKNKHFPAKVTMVIIILDVAVFGINAILGIGRFLANPSTGFDISIVIGLVTWSALSRLYNKRFKRN